MSDERRLVLEEILDEHQINHVLQQVIGKNIPWSLKNTVVSQAVDGIAGFLGDHMKAVLHVEVDGEVKEVRLFLKRIPTDNKAKADFIHENNFFKREKLMFSLLEEICQNGPEPWCTKAYVYTDSIFVMPDLTAEGYTCRNYFDDLDLKHVTVATTSIARFHAAFVNYETKKSKNLNRPYTTSEEFGNLLKEPTFSNSSWPTQCAEMSVNILKTFSTKLYSNMPDLEANLAELYLRAGKSLKEYNDTVNILNHKDLWVNNIMFKYENDEPINAILIDYQCLKYAPPVFDLMVFLYLTTDRRFREEHERHTFDHYYSTFENNLNDASKERLKTLGYDKENFFCWCEKARMCALFEAIGMFPQILMDPKTAQETFEDPENFEKFIDDGSKPVLAYASICERYKNRNLAVIEEFIETYLYTGRTII